MPIIDFEFKNRIFFAKESGIVSDREAADWAQKLEGYAKQSEKPIVALVDALSVKGVSAKGQDIFSKASFTRNVVKVVVAANIRVSLTASNISLLGKQNQTVVFGTLNEAREYAEELVADKPSQKS